MRVRSFVIGSAVLPSAVLSVAVLLLAGCREQVVHNLSENDSTRMITQLSERGIQAFRDRQTDGRWTVSVDSSETKLALKLIDSRRLLRQERRAPEDSGSVLASREEQRFKYERSVSREIEDTLGALEGVLDARVHLNLPPVDPLLGQPLVSGKGSASVLLITGIEFKMEPEEIGSIVAGASGIERELVSVLLSQSSDESASSAPSQAPVQLIAGDAPATELQDALTGLTVRHERLFEGIVSVLILGFGLFAMRMAVRGRKRAIVRLGDNPGTAGSRI